MTGSTKNQQHKAWISRQINLWENRTGDYQKLDWVGKQDFMEFLVAFCDLQPDWYALDVGFGPGVVAGAIAPHVDTVCGIDLTESMVSLANKNYPDKKKFRFSQADVEKMEFEDNTFDLVTARMSFHHVDRCDKGLEEVFRVLKPGGRFVLCEGVPPDHRVRNRYKEIFALKEERHTFSEAELINLLDNAGFIRQELRPFFMRQNSLQNWLSNGAVDEDAYALIWRLHVEADDYFKMVYNMVETEEDVLMDWKFILLKGYKPE